MNILKENLHSKVIKNEDNIFLIAIYNYKVIFIYANIIVSNRIKHIFLKHIIIIININNNGWMCFMMGINMSNIGPEGVLPSVAESKVRRKLQKVPNDWDDGRDCVRTQHLPSTISFESRAYRPLVERNK